MIRKKVHYKGRIINQAVSFNQKKKPRPTAEWHSENVRRRNDRKKAKEDWELADIRVGRVCRSALGGAFGKESKELKRTALKGLA